MEEDSNRFKSYRDYEYRSSTNWNLRVITQVWEPDEFRLKHVESELGETYLEM